jgi:hypothetical protein
MRIDLKDREVEITLVDFRTPELQGKLLFKYSEFVAVSRKSEQQSSEGCS